MKRKLYLTLFSLLLLSFTAAAQGGSETELKSKAIGFFEENNFKEAKLLYAQLLSLYPKDLTYNYRYGACVLQTESDKTKPLKYLEFATSKSTVDPLAYYYLGRAYHLNYEFAKAVKQYSKFNNKAKNDEKEKYDAARQIEMAKNGNNLLSKLNEVQVIERQEISLKDFYRIYDEKAIGGKILSKPEEFQSKLDKKKNDKSVMFFPNEAKEVYYSSLGKKGENGRDIYKAVKLGNGAWSDGVNLGSSINTKYDEDYAFIKPDGRTLYFASKGHTSMGGYDIFKSVLDDVTGEWTEPENLDFAFSSADDDIMFITDQPGLTAYFASNRSNEFGKITVYKVLIERIPAELSAISGQFISESNPDEKKAKITVIDKNTKETIGVYETDDNGNYKIEIAQNGGDYQFNIETTEDAPIHTGVVTIPKQSEFEVLGQELRLVGSGDAQQLVIKNIFDGTAVAANGGSGQGPKISSELIKMKASLSVNFSESDLAAIQEKQKKERASVEQTALKVEEIELAELTNVEDKALDSQEALFSDETKEDADVKGIVEENNRSDVEEPSSNSNEITSLAITTKIKQLKTIANQNVEVKQTAISRQYAKSLALQESAKRSFNEKTTLETNGANSIAIQLKEKEAGISALKAAYAVQVAQSLEESINNDLSNLDRIESAELKINTAIESENLAEAELTLNNLKQIQENSNTASEILKNGLSEVDEEDRIADKKINDFSAKNNSFKVELANLNKQLITLESGFEKASKKKKNEIQKNIAATQLDIEDISYQGERLNEDLIEAKLSKKSLNYKVGELNAAANRLNSTEEFTPISEIEKNQLIAELKIYRDNDQLAYSATNELYANEIDEVVANEINSTTSNLIDESTVPNIIDESTSTNDQDEKVIADKGSNEDGNETINIPSESNTNSVKDYSNIAVTTINSDYNSKISEAELVEDVELKLAKQINVYTNWIEDLNGKKSVTQSEYDAEIDEAERTYLKTELDDLQANLNEKNSVKKRLETELSQRASGSFNESVTTIASINEINSGTIVAAEFTNFKFNQNYGASSATTSDKLTTAKRSLFEASQYSTQAEQAQQAAYSLPTAAERTQAFTEVNDLKALSEKKQLESAKQFAEFNLLEFRENQTRLREANQFNGKYNTESLDMAELLGEEAETYFTDAAIIRANVNVEQRLSQQQVELQKAYDYEILALKKQKEALGKLGNVVSEVVYNRLGTKNTPKKAPFIQVIEDQNILAVVSSTEAVKQIELKQASIVDINAEISENEKTAYNLDSGNEKDGLNARNSELIVEKESILEEIALLYERDRQIKEGLVGATPIDNSPQTKVLAFRKATVINQISLDTVEVTDDRKELILALSDFISFSNNRQEIAKQVKAAEIEYNQAIAIAEENNRLQKQAIIETNKAKAVLDQSEKQRLVKSAQVINLTIAQNEQKIETLNNSIKVKNFLVINLEKKDQSTLANLSQVERNEFQLLTKDYIPENLATYTEAPFIPKSPETISSGEELASETAKAPLKLPEIETSNGLLDLPEGVEVDNSEDDILENKGDQTGETTSNEIINYEGGDVAEGADSEVELVEISDEIKPLEIESVSNLPSRTEKAITIENIDVVPRQIKQAIFVTLNRNESAYNAAKPIPTKASLPEGIVYKVQIGAFRNVVAESTFKGFAPLMKENAGNGITRYTAGLFGNESTALKARNQIRELGYRDAFVVAFKNGKRLSIKAARGETGEKVDINNAESFSNASNSTNLENSTTKVGSKKVTPIEGGSKEALSPSFSSSEIAEVVNTETVSGLIFTVQIGVYSKPVTKGTFEYEDLNVVEISNELFRYNAGLFSNAINAAELKNTISIKIPDAFVAAYYNGKRVSLVEASKLKK